MSFKAAYIGDIQKVLANMEGVSIRDMVTIMETLADYTNNKDTDMLTEYVRQSMKRNITKRFIADMQAKVITLDAALEQAIMDSVADRIRIIHNLEPNMYSG